MPLYSFFYPIIHLLPGMRDMSFIVRYEQANVAMAISGISSAVGNSKPSFISATQGPNQKICTRYIPKLRFERFTIALGSDVASMQVNNRKAPNVNTTQLMVQNAQPTSITGVECTTPGTACT